MVDNLIKSDVLVFKTSLRPEDRENVAKLLSRENILEWTIDFEDIDKVLRIESIDFSYEDIIKLMNNSGYTCEELI